MIRIISCVFLVSILLLCANVVLSQDIKIDSTNNYDTTLNNTIQIVDSLIANDTLNTANSDSTVINQPSDSVIVFNDSTQLTIDSSTSIVPLDSAQFSLNGYLFNITDTFVIEKWKYNTDIHNFDFSTYDSTLREFHITHPAYKQVINNNYLGNSGLAVQSSIFFDPNLETGFLFLKSFTPYMHQSKHETYYNAQKPFTLFGYQTGPKQEQNIELIHTQNVNKHLNAFLKFNSYSGTGHYLYQETKNNSGALGFAHVRNRFSTHANYTFSKINVEENGGIIDPYFVTDSALTLSPTEMGNRLTDGNNYMKDRQWFFDQKIGFVKNRKNDTSKTGGYLFSIQYNYHYQKGIRIYEDDDTEYTNPISGETLFAYENNYSGTSTFDTSSYITNQHLFRLNLEESPGNWLGFGAYVGIGKHYTKHSYYNKDTLFIYDLNKKNESVFFEGGIFRLRPSNLNFYGHYRLFLNGYRKNDIMISGKISVNAGKGLFQSILSAEGKIESKTADYFLTDYKSNHYQWSNKFEKENITELKGKYVLPKLNTSLGARYALLTNHIYFNTSGVPDQFESDFNVFDAYINNTLSAFNFNLNSKINYQKSGKQDIMPLPEWSFYHALYYEKNIHFKATQGDMKLQLGVDVDFWTKYHAQVYSPATAQFHNQTSQEIGNYPFIGAFLNLEIKRMRIYIKGEHINYSYMLSNDLVNNFRSPNYPTPLMVIKYGLTWTFYD